MPPYPLTMAFNRIVVDQKVMAGVPCIRGTRLPVADGSRHGGGGDDVCPNQGGLPSTHG